MSISTPIQVARWSITALDLSLDAVAHAAGVSLAGRTHIEYGETIALWRAAEAILGDPTIGHRCGVQVRPHEMGPLGGIMAHAATFGRALDDLASVLPLVLPGRFAVARTEDGARVTYRRPETSARSRHGVESMFAGIVAHGRHCTRRRFRVHAVSFDHRATPHHRSVYDAFYGVPVRWDAREAAVEFDQDTLALPMSAANPALSRLLLEHAEESLGAMSLIERRASQALVVALSHGEPTLAATASQMGLSERTLQRQLDAANVSFRELRGRVLRLQAERLLRDPNLSIEAVAAACGYDSRTGFDRAFRSWAGCTPAAFRRGGLDAVTDAP